MRELTKTAAATLIALLLTTASSVTSPAHAAAAAQKPLPPAERLALVRRAQVWIPTVVGLMDLRAGPPAAGFDPGAPVGCDFVNKEFGGHTPKFGCTLDREHVLKVRYGRDNGEVYAGVAATRLMWALGFGADALYPVRVVCRNCPDKMKKEGAPAPGSIRFDIAAIERSFPGRDVDGPHGIPGWSWRELDLVDPSAGGAPVSQRDALKLLAVLLQHTDNKADQQRLVCRGAGSHGDLANCPEPFMMIHDLGQTFGRANLFNRSAVSSVNLERWSKAPVWKDPVRCIGNLAQSQTGTLADPPISEAGRKFLADLLVQLSDAQLIDLFSAARFADKPHGGGPVDAWVAAFKQKRDEIVSARCQ